MSNINHVRRWCDLCKKVELHWVKDGQNICTFCMLHTKRYDTRPRSWAGV